MGQQHRTHSIRGSLVCGYHNVFLTLYFLLAGQPHLCMQQCLAISAFSLDQAVLSVVLQHFVCSPLFLGGRAPHEHTVAPHYLHTFSGQGSPAGRYCSVLLAPQLFRQGCPLCVQPSGNMKRHPASCAGSISGLQGPLYSCYSALLFLLGLAPVGWLEHATELCRSAREPGWSSHLL